MKTKITIAAILLVCLFGEGLINKVTDTEPKGLIAPAQVTTTICPDCEEPNCIYQQINNAVQGEETDANISSAVYKVCAFRGIEDEETIELILSNYDL